MKKKDLVQMWAAYAHKLLKASDGNLIATVRAMNLNNKHRAQFLIDGTRITFNGETVIDTSV